MKESTVPTQKPTTALTPMQELFRYCYIREEYEQGQREAWGTADALDKILPPMPTQPEPEAHSGVDEDCDVWYPVHTSGGKLASPLLRYRVAAALGAEWIDDPEYVDGVPTPGASYSFNIKPCVVPPEHGWAYEGCPLTFDIANLMLGGDYNPDDVVIYPPYEVRTETKTFNNLTQWIKLRELLKEEYPSEG